MVYEGHMLTTIQAYFSGTHAASFPVDTAQVGLTSDDLYSAYLDQVAPKIEGSTLVNKVLTSNEVSALLRVTMWHKHLAQYLGDKQTIDDLLTLTTLPTSTWGMLWLGVPLCKATIAYLHDTANKVGSSGIGICCLLHECPRFIQNGNYWRPLSNEQSITKYVLTLQKWVHAILLSKEPNNVSGYKFPLTDHDHDHGKALKAALLANNQDNTVLMLH